MTARVSASAATSHASHARPVVWSSAATPLPRGGSGIARSRASASALAGSRSASRSRAGWPAADSRQRRTVRRMSVCNVRSSSWSLLASASQSSSLERLALRTLPLDDAFLSFWSIASARDTLSPSADPAEGGRPAADSARAARMLRAARILAGSCRPPASAQTTLRALPSPVAPLPPPMLRLRLWSCDALAGDSALEECRPERHAGPQPSARGGTRRLGSANSARHKHIHTDTGGNTHTPAGVQQLGSARRLSRAPAGKVAGRKWRCQHALARPCLTRGRSGLGAIEPPSATRAHPVPASQGTRPLPGQRGAHARARKPMLLRSRPAGVDGVRPAQMVPEPCGVAPKKLPDPAPMSPSSAPNAW